MSKEVVGLVVVHESLVTASMFKINHTPTDSLLLDCAGLQTEILEFCGSQFCPCGTVNCDAPWLGVACKSSDVCLRAKSNLVAVSAKEFKCAAHKYPLIQISAKAFGDFVYFRNSIMDALLMPPIMILIA